MKRYIIKEQQNFEQERENAQSEKMILLTLKFYCVKD